MNELLTSTNLGFLAVMGVVALLLGIRKVPLHEWGSHFIAVGILGTFYGIMVALLGFDTNSIDQSVPRLIDGMRTAFATSVVGMGLAVGTRIVSVISSKSGPEAGDPTAEDYLEVMRAQQKTLQAIQAAVGGEGDGSLLTQMGKIRLDMNDFMKKLEKQSVDAIIEALKQVVADFNKNLTEQFGENFKQLNEAVGRMLTWMEQHKQALDQSEQRLQTAVEAMEVASEGMTTSAAALQALLNAADQIRRQAIVTVQSVSELPPHLDAIRVSLEAVRGSVAQMGGEAGTLATNVAALSAALPALTTASDELAEGLLALEDLARDSGSTSQALEQMTRSVRENAESVAAQHRELIQTLADQVDELAGGLGAAQDKLIGSLGAAMKSQVDQLGASLNQAQNAAFAQLKRDLEASGNRNREVIDRQIKTLDEALQKELTAALQTMGVNLAALSQTFVKDYKPLTAELARLLQLAREVEAARRSQPGG